MPYTNRYQKRNGFTLLELMIVVVILGVLAALAIPRFMTATTRTKRSEAGIVLKQIYVLQQAYKEKNGHYGDDGTSVVAANPNFPGSGGGSFVEIGAEIQVNNRYEYYIVSSAATFTATAVGNLDDDVTDDVWEINETGALVCTSNDATS